MNNKVHLAIRLGNKTVIGDHSVILKTHSEFVYKALTEMDFYALRKNKLQEIYDKYVDIGYKLKTKVIAKYNKFIRLPVLEHKMTVVRQLKRLNKLEFLHADQLFKEGMEQEEAELRQLKQEKEHRGGDKLALRRIKKLEQRFEELSQTVYNIYKKYDENIRDLCEM